MSRYLPRLLPDGDQITVRQLLNHTSGLYDPQVEVYQTLQDIYDLRFEHWTPRQVMALANEGGLLFPPGTAWSYSNTNYVVAGLLIERVTGTSIARQLERRLIRPLGLRHTWFPTSTAALPPPRLHGYMPLDDQPPLVDADITWFNPSFFWASGALVSNVDDLDRVYDALFDGRLLPRRLLAEMLTPVDTGAPGSGYGLGLEIYTLPCGATVAGHTGALPGYNSARSGCSATTRTPGWWPTSTRPGRAERRPVGRPVRDLLRHGPGRGQRRRPGQPRDRRGDPLR